MTMFCEICNLSLPVSKSVIVLTLFLCVCRMRAKLLGGRAIALQTAVRNFLAKQELKSKRDARRKQLGVTHLKACFRRYVTRTKYVRMLQAVWIQEKRKEEEMRKQVRDLPTKFSPGVSYFLLVCDCGHMSDCAALCCIAVALRAIGDG